MTRPLLGRILGSTVRFGVVLLAGFSEAAGYEGGPCSGMLCGHDGQICPAPPEFLSVTVTGLALTSAAINLGLSQLSTHRIQRARAPVVPPDRPPAAGYPTTATILLFLWWGPRGLRLTTTLGSVRPVHRGLCLRFQPARNRALHDRHGRSRRWFRCCPISRAPSSW